MTNIGNGEYYGVNIKYSIEETALETGGGIAKALPWLGNEPFILINGDIWTNYNFDNLVNYNPIELAHLVMVTNPEENIEGDFALEHGIITLSDIPRLTYSGIALINPQLFKDCIVRPFSWISLLDPFIMQKKISGEYFTGCWHDIGSISQLKKLNTELLLEV